MQLRLRRKSDGRSALSQVSRDLEASVYMKASLNAFAAFEAISNDVWTLSLAPYLKATEQ